MGITISSLIDQANAQAAANTVAMSTRQPLPPMTQDLMPVVWKCRVAGCTARERHAEVLVRTQWKRTRPTIRNGGETRIYSKMRPIAPAPWCPFHDFRMKGKPILGVFDESVDCGPKCAKAIGTSCRCVCGGANHGTAVA